jgi:LacI family transcriptional regulator
MSITMTELARLAKVSQSTVSLVLNEQPGRRISPETETRIRRLAQQHNFRVNRAAVKLRRGDTSVIGICMATTNHPDNALKTLHFQEFFQKRGYRVIFSFYSQLDGVGTALENIFEHGVDGLLAWDYHPLIEQENIPTVFYSIQNPNYDCVTWDAVKYAEDVIAVATQCGFRHIVSTSGLFEDTRNPELRRLTAETGIALEFLACDNLIDCVRRSRSVFSTCRQPVLFLSNDFLAVGIYAAAAEYGLRIPDDVSVLGMDNLPTAPYMQPPLSTFDFDLEKLCVTLSDLLIKRIKDKERRVKHVLQPMELIVRQSVKGLNA